jgi:uncharacterized membrane protein
LWRKILGTILVLGYPPLVYFGLREGHARWVAGVLLLGLVPGLVARARQVGWDRLWAVARPVLPTIVIAVVVAISGDGRLLLAVPVVISLGLLLGFGATLRGEGPPMVERFARLVHADMTPAEVVHCRTVTVIWCVFFALNAITAGVLAWLDSVWWALYTGFLAYAAMGLLFGAEFVVRKARFRRYGPGLHDRLLSRLFPPRP